MNLKDLCNYSTKQTELYDTPYDHHEHLFFDNLSVKGWDSEESEYDYEAPDAHQKPDNKTFNERASSDTVDKTPGKNKNSSEAPYELQSYVDPISMDELLDIVRQEISERGVEAVVEDCAYHWFLGKTSKFVWTYFIAYYRS